MARGRFLSKEITEDAAVDALPNDTARLLFTWMIPYADVEGRLWGEARQIMSKVFFLRTDVTESEIDEYLDAMHALGLIERYTVDGRRYIRFPKWEKHQTLRKDREAPSKIPAPTPGVTPGVTPAALRPQEEGEVKVYRLDGNREELAQDAPAAQANGSPALPAPPFTDLNITIDAARESEWVKAYQDATGEWIANNPKARQWLVDLIGRHTAPVVLNGGLEFARMKRAEYGGGLKALDYYLKHPQEVGPRTQVKDLPVMKQEWEG